MSGSFVRMSAAVVAVVWLAAAVATMIRGWTVGRFASSLTVAGLIGVAVTGLMFLGPGPRIINVRMRAAEEVFTRDRQPKGQNPADWLQGRGNPQAPLIVAFALAVGTLAAGIVLAYTAS